MDNEIGTAEYRFEYREAGKQLAGFPREKYSHHCVTFSDEERWPAVMYEFAKWLGMQYGYDIVDSITVKGKPLGDAAIEPSYKPAIMEALKEFDEEDIRDLGKATMKKKEKKKKIKNYFMGNASDWEGEE